MSAVFGISSEAIVAMNQAVEEMESVSEALEEVAKSFELEFTVEDCSLEVKKLLLEKMEYEDIVIEPENPKPHHREKLHPYSKRRKFVKKPYWNRIRSRLF